MAEAVMNCAMVKPRIRCSWGQQLFKTDSNPPCKLLGQSWSLCLGNSHHQLRRASTVGRVNALPDFPLMAVLVESFAGQGRELVTHKTIWHLNDEQIKNVYTLYIMFTAWGCCYFGSVKDPYYDSDAYRKDGGDGTGHWVYEKQEEIEENARAELWREELIEEIEQKVGGLRELEEAGKKKEEALK
uniref:Photosynthetic NDH subcomplex B 4 n=1 Tax=Kalanchoe fedtschenkoi TaxID=63787 RepID=A0A7N0V3J5_KALFE